MHFKLIFKTLFIIVVLALLVILGQSNTDTVNLKMPILKPLTSTSGYMYYGFFAVGFLSGTVMMAGGKKGGGAGRSNKAQT